MKSVEQNHTAASNAPEQIFIVGMNGSGTTMLLDHLANHPSIFGFPTETKSLPFFIKQEAAYGDLNDEKNYLRLWNDMKESVVEGTSQSCQEIPAPEVHVRSAASAFNHIMRHLAQAQGKQIWCEKTPMHVHHLGLLAQAFPDAKFIHIIRDGRDCAASFHRRWRFNPVRTVFRWKRAVSEGREQGHRLRARYFEVRYEDITEAPEAEFRRLFSFLAIPFEPSVLSSERSRLGAVGSGAGEVTRNVRRAEGYFSPRLVRSMERVGGRLLTELGYSCDERDGDQDPGRWQLKWWQVTDDFRRFWTLLFRKGRILKPSKWGYVLNRVRSAVKQKSTS